MSELKFIFTGTAGAGKTTAIATISDFPPVSTEMVATDDLRIVKNQTTVAMDFGEMTLESGEKVFLYGTPGQERFRHMWEILVRGGLGLFILIDNTRPSPLDDLRIYLENFRTFIEETGAVIAVTRSDLSLQPALEEFQDVLTACGLILPIVHADPRKREDVLLLLNMLMAIVELNHNLLNVDGADNEYCDALGAL